MRLLYSFMLILAFSLDIQAKRLNEQPLKISIVYNKRALRLPDSKLEIGVQVLMPDSTVLRTRNIGGKLGFNNFTFDITNGGFQFGKLIFPDNLRNSASLTVTCKDFPEVHTSKTFLVHKEHDLKLNLSNSISLSPGQAFPLKLEALVFNDYFEEFRINPPLDQYDIELSGGTYKRGKIKILDDPRNIENHQVKLLIKPIDQPVSPQEFSLILDYQKSYTFSDRGFFGSSGLSGFSGASNQNGQHGKDGEHGEDGPDIDVYVHAYTDSILETVLLDVEVITLNREKFFRINPDGGSLKVVTQGGDGGDGGNGGDGGKGRDGRNGQVYKKRIATSDSTWREIEIRLPGENGGTGRDGGHGGWAGDGGYGGNITIYYNAFAEPYLPVIHGFSIGGDGGNGGSGGQGGRGGRGGNGEPSGNNGLDGHNGLTGRNGYDGDRGDVRYFLLNE